MPAARERHQLIVAALGETGWVRLVKRDQLAHGHVLAAKNRVFALSGNGFGGVIASAAFAA